MYIPLIALFLVLGAWQAKLNVPPTTATEKSSVHNRNSDNKTSESSKKEPEQSPSTKGVSGSETQVEPCRQKKERGSESVSPLYQAYLWATIAGVVGGLIGILFVWKQVKSAKVSAEAAVKNSQAIMDSERAWISVDVRAGKANPDTVELVVRNCGRTPAFISEVKGIIVASIQELPAEPPKESVLMRQSLVAPNESFSIPLKDTLVLWEIPYQVIVAGIVRYTSVYRDKERYELPPSTRFCYRARRTEKTSEIVFSRVWNEFYNSYT